MLHSQRTGSTDRGTGYLPTRRTEQQWHELPLKMSPSKCIIIFSLVLLPFAEATAISRSRAAVLSAQLTRKSPPPESTFSKGVRFQGESEARAPTVGTSRVLLRPQQEPTSFAALWSPLMQPARQAVGSARRVGRMLLTGGRNRQQMQQQALQQHPLPPRPSMRIGTQPSAPRVGQTFNLLMARRPGGISPPTLGKLTDLAEPYKPADDVAAAIAAATKARTTGLIPAGVAVPSLGPARAAAAGRGALPAARGGPEYGFAKRDLTADDFKLADVSARIRKAEEKLSKQREEQEKRQREGEEAKRKEEERSREREREEERRRKEDEERKEQEEKRRRQEEAEKREGERRRREAEERKQREQGKQRREEAERQRKKEEEESRKRKEVEERKKQEEEEARKRKEAEDRQKRAEEERRKKKEAEEKRKKEEEESRKRKEVEERKKQEEEEARKRKEAEDRQKRAEEERRKKKEAEEKRKKEEEESRKRKEVEERKKQEEEEARKRKEAEDRQKRAEEERRKKKEAEEKRKKEEEERKRKGEEERQRKQKEQEEGKRKEEEEQRRKKAADILGSQLKLAAQKPRGRRPFAMGKSQEELLKEAEVMFKEVDEDARRSRMFEQPPMPALTRSNYLSEEEKLAATNPSIDPSIPEEHMKRALDVLKSVARKYSDKVDYFPDDSLRVQTAVNDNPRGGCHTMTTNWSECSSSCGVGSRMRLTRGVKGSSCLTTAEPQICISSVGCKSGEQFLTAMEGELSSIPQAAKEELGRLMMKNIKLNARVEEKLVCKEYDTGFTARVYNDKGLVGDFGVGMQFRLFQRLDEGKGTCEGDIDVQFVSRFEKLTMADFSKNILEDHNSIRKKHGITALKWNPLISANMLHYLRQQDEHEQCRMEHSPRNTRELPGVKSPLGENLYTACSLGSFPRKVATAWATEGHCFRFGKIGNPCTGVLGPKCSTEMHAQGLMTGHYTATVWEGSMEVGCAYVVCNRKCQHNRPVILVGCQYSPAGNVVGRTPFSKDVALAAQGFFPQLLPEASEDPIKVKECERFMEEMEKKNPKVDFVAKWQ